MSISKTMEVVLGVDTHLDIHVGVLINVTGQLIGSMRPATSSTQPSKAGTWCALKWIGFCT